MTGQPSSLPPGLVIGQGSHASSVASLAAQNGRDLRVNSLPEAPSGLSISMVPSIVSVIYYDQNKWKGEIQE